MICKNVLFLPHVRHVYGRDFGFGSQLRMEFYCVSGDSNTVMIEEFTVSD